MSHPSVPSPCTRNCCLDADDRCLGCLRTLAEIAAWGAQSDAERLETLERCRQRAAQAGLGVCLALQGEGEPEGAADPKLALDSDRATVGLDERLCDR